MRYEVVFKCIKGHAKKKTRFAFNGLHTIVIGRLKGCHFRINDPEISQSHCLVQIQNNELCIIDMGSKFGTWLNDERIEGLRTLSHNDLIKIGSTVLQINFISPPSHKAESVEITPPDTPKIKLPEENRAISQSDTKHTSTISPPLPEPTPPPSTLSKSKGVIPQSQLRRQCMLCKQFAPKQYMLHTAPQWGFCARCEELAHFIDNDLADSYRLIGIPQQVTATGVTLLVERKDTKKWLFVSRVPQQKLPLSALEHVKEVGPLEYNNILTSEEIHEKSKYLWITFPYYPGEFLSKATEVSSSEAVDLIITLTQTLEYAHAQWGPHGEIYPGSIYLRCDGEPFLYGYGLPRVLHWPHPPIEARAPHLQYTTPEYIQTPGDVSTGTDLFALAGVLLQLWFQRNIYKGITLQELQTEVSQYTPPALSLETRPMIRNFFATVLAREKYHRYPEIPHFLDALHVVRCLIKE